MTRRTAKPAPGHDRQPGAQPAIVGSGHVVANQADQQTEAITSSAPPAAPKTGIAVPVANPVTQPTEDISRAERPSREEGSRLSTGARIVETPEQSQAEKIVRAPLQRPAGDEMARKKLFTRFEEAFLTGDIDALRGCLSPAFQWHLPNGAVIYGREEALAEMERRFAMPNGPKFSRTVWRFKDTTVIQTYEVEFLGSDGRWRTSRGMDLYDIGGGLITSKDAFWKMVP